VGERVHVEGQVVASALLARFDQHHAPRVRRALRLERLERRQRGEGGVPVVADPAPVELVAAAHGRPRAAPCRPADHFRLLVTVAVEEHGLATRDRKSTRLNSSHVAISYAVFCLKKKKKKYEVECKS